MAAWLRRQERQVICRTGKSLEAILPLPACLCGSKAFENACAQKQILRMLSIGFRDPVLVAQRFHFPKIVKYAVVAHPASIAEARIAVVTKREAGMRWTRDVIRRLALLRTTKACGPGALD
jgi:hypothetical protein